MTCPTPHKVRYLSRAKARKRRLRGHPAERMRAYLCTCGFWHLGHLSQARKDGRLK